MLSTFTIVPPKNDIFSYEDITLTKINKILTNRILLDEDIEWMKFKLSEFQQFDLLDYDLLLLFENIQLLKNITTTRDLKKLRAEIKENSVKKEYRSHLANHSIPNYCGFDLLPTEIRQHIFNFTPFNKRIKLNTISKQINHDINNSPLPENYIYPKRLIGIISTKNLNNNFTLKQLHQVIKNIPEKKKLKIIKKSEIHAFNKAELYYTHDFEHMKFRHYNRINDRQKLSCIMLVCLLTITGVMAGLFLPLNISSCREETGEIKNICSNTGKILLAGTCFITILFLLNEIFGSPSKAKRTVLNTTQCFFKQVNATGYDSNFHEPSTKIKKYRN